MDRQAGQKRVAREGEAAAVGGGPKKGEEEGNNEAAGRNRRAKSKSRDARGEGVKAAPPPPLGAPVAPPGTRVPGGPPAAGPPGGGDSSPPPRGRPRDRPSGESAGTPGLLGSPLPRGSDADGAIDVDDDDVDVDGVDGAVGGLSGSSVGFAGAAARMGGDYFGTSARSRAEALSRSYVAELASGASAVVAHGRALEATLGSSGNESLKSAHLVSGVKSVPVEELWKSMSGDILTWLQFLQGTPAEAHAALKLVHGSGPFPLNAAVVIRSVDVVSETLPKAGESARKLILDELVAAFGGSLGHPTESFSAPGFYSAVKKLVNLIATHGGDMPLWASEFAPGGRASAWFEDFAALERTLRQAGSDGAVAISRPIFTAARSVAAVVTLPQSGAVGQQRLRELLVLRFFVVVVAHIGGLRRLSDLLTSKYKDLQRGYGAWPIASLTESTKFKTLEEVLSNLARMRKFVSHIDQLTPSQDFEWREALMHGTFETLERYKLVSVDTATLLYETIGDEPLYFGAEALDVLRGVLVEQNARAMAVGRGFSLSLAPSGAGSGVLGAPQRIESSSSSMRGFGHGRFSADGRGARGGGAHFERGRSPSSSRGGASTAVAAAAVGGAGAGGGGRGGEWSHGSAGPDAKKQRHKERTCFSCGQLGHVQASCPSSAAASSARGGGFSGRVASTSPTPAVRPAPTAAVVPTTATASAARGWSRGFSPGRAAATGGAGERVRLAAPAASTVASVSAAAAAAASTSAFPRSVSFVGGRPAVQSSGFGGGAFRGRGGGTGGAGGRGGASGRGRGNS